ncbi:MAG: hypothetical protein ABII22_00255 [Candidatus Micrarchaeota archaeon]
MKHCILAIFGILLLFGCVSPPPDGNGQNISIVKEPPKYTNLKTNDQLRMEFGCDRGAKNATSYGDLVVWYCAKDSRSFMEKGMYDYGFFEIGAHPMGTWFVTYIIFDGKNYTEIEEVSKLEPYFIPIQSDEEAIVYVQLHEGLNMLEGLGSPPFEKSSAARVEGDSFMITIVHEDWEMCPCYGTVWSSEYKVTLAGEITRISSKIIREIDKQDCNC